MARREYPDDSEIGGEPPPQIVHNHYQTKNGNGGSNISTLNSILLACLLGIVGFVGLKVWNMSERLVKVETNIETILREARNL